MFLKPEYFSPAITPILNRQNTTRLNSFINIIWLNHWRIFFCVNQRSSSTVELWFPVFSLKMTQTRWFAVSILHCFPVSPSPMIIFLWFHSTNLSLTLYIIFFCHPSPRKFSKDPNSLLIFLHSRTHIDCNERNRHFSITLLLRHAKPNHDWRIQTFNYILRNSLGSISGIQKRTCFYQSTVKFGCWPEIPGWGPDPSGFKPLNNKGIFRV